MNLLRLLILLKKEKLSKVEREDLEDEALTIAPRQYLMNHRDKGVPAKEFDNVCKWVWKSLGVKDTEKFRPWEKDFRMMSSKILKAFLLEFHPEAKQAFRKEKIKKSNKKLK